MSKNFSFRPRAGRGDQSELFLEAPNRLPVCPVIVVRRVDVAKVAEVKEVRKATIRSNRPIAAEVADLAQRPIIEVAITRSGVPSGRRTDA